MSTVNAGNPNDPETEPTGGIPWVALLLGGLALIFVVLVGPRVVGVLFGIMAPPEPPVPPNARLLTYSREAYGVDVWTYDTTQDICDLVLFFKEQGGDCPIFPPRCATKTDSVPQSSPDLIAQCVGDMEFSVFAMRWQFAIPVRSISPQRPRFDLSREIFWTGDLPPASR
ncbi:MAG: hypothetical protein CL610_11570 [Anaerolineaceae bacterium]|nr:hypothetical protein [Anaerolineaceae bacterium]